jgi:hypothetical protein
MIRSCSGLTSMNFGSNLKLTDCSSWGTPGSQSGGGPERSHTGCTGHGFTFPGEADDARSSEGRPDGTGRASTSRGWFRVEAAGVRAARRLLHARVRVVRECQRLRERAASPSRCPRWPVERPDGRRASRTRQGSGPADRSVPPVEESPRCLLPGWSGWNSSLGPFDEGGRNLVAHDHDAQNAIVAEERRDPEASRVNRRVTSPRGGETGRRSAPHRGYQFEHGREHPDRKCRAPKPPRDVPDCTADSTDVSGAVIAEIAGFLTLMFPPWR